MFEKIRSIISEQLSIDDVDTITLDTSLTEDLEADSLDAVEVIMALEDEFGIEIPDEEAEHFKTIGDICKFIEYFSIKNNKLFPKKTFEINLGFYLLLTVTIIIVIIK